MRRGFMRWNFEAESKLMPIRSHCMHCLQHRTAQRYVQSIDPLYICLSSDCL